jgi:hypothetical protein
LESECFILQAAVLIDVCHLTMHPFLFIAAAGRWTGKAALILDLLSYTDITKASTFLISYYASRAHILHMF